ncbi:MAG: hypothetical protein Q9192_006082, partial [Flavoplaca navasiana]
MAQLAPLVVPALKKHTATVIWAHGLGDTLSMAENYRRRGKFEEVAFIFPNAPSIPITVVSAKAPIKHLGITQHLLTSLTELWYANARLVRHCETATHPFPLVPLPTPPSNLLTNPPSQIAFNDLAQAQDQPGILKSRDYFHQLIKTEIDKGIPSSRIILGGFSQGGSISIFAGLTSPYPLAGIFGLSSYLLLADALPKLVTPALKSANSNTPIFMGHGEMDPLVKLEWGQKTAE